MATIVTKPIKLRIGVNKAVPIKLRLPGATNPIKLKLTNPITAGDKNFSTSFATQSTINVNHGLGKRPAVTILDTAGDEVVGSVNHVDLNNLIITLSAPTSGVITCN